MDTEHIEQTVSKVSKLLEQASLSASRFESCFGEVSALLGARSFHLAELSPSGEQRFLVHETGRQMLQAYYEEGWHDLDVWTKRALRPSLKGQVVFDHMVIPESEAIRDPYIQEYCADWGVRHFSAFAWRTESQTFGFTIIRPTDNPFTYRDALILQKVRPVAISAFLASSILRDSHFRGIAAGLELAGRPSVILNQFGQITFMSRGAEVLQGRAFKCVEGRLRGVEPHSDASFRRLEAWILGKVSSPPQAFRITSPFQGAPVFAFCLPLRELAYADLPGAAVLVMFVDPSQHPAARPQQFVSFWGLTPREADLAHLIACGSTLEQAAEILKLKLSTVRQMHKALLTKTGTTGKAELAVILAKLSMGF